MREWERGQVVVVVELRLDGRRAGQVRRHTLDPRGWLLDLGSGLGLGIGG